MQRKVSHATAGASATSVVMTVSATVTRTQSAPRLSSEAIFAEAIVPACHES